MTNTPICIFISFACADSAFANRLVTDIHPRGWWFIWVWHAWCLLWQEVLHA